jgi:hypothetical protein
MRLLAGALPAMVRLADTMAGERPEAIMAIVQFNTLCAAAIAATMITVSPAWAAVWMISTVASCAPAGDPICPSPRLQWGQEVFPKTDSGLAIWSRNGSERTTVTRSIGRIRSAAKVAGALVASARGRPEGDAEATCRCGAPYATLAADLTGLVDRVTVVRSNRFQP